LILLGSLIIAGFPPTPIVANSFVTTNTRL
jgi:hypothetical protein